MEIAKGRRADYGSPPHIPRGSPIPWVSPCVSYLLPTHKPVPRSNDIDIGWPTSLVGGERPGGSEFGCVGTEKKNEISQQIYSKEDVNEVLTFLTCLAAFVEARGEAKSKIDRGQLC